MSELHERLTYLREKKGWTKTYVAKKLQLNNLGTYANWEYGTREPDAAMITKIANLYEVSTDYLLGNSETPIINDVVSDKRKTPDFANDLEWINDPELGYWWHSLTESEIKSLKKLWDVIEESKKNAEK